MSETPDVSMDLLELEDGLVVHDSEDAGVNIESVFPGEEGEEESPREEDDVVWTPFLGPNPMTEIEFLFEDLFLVEVSHVITELHHGGTSSICLEKHAMVAAPQGEYISNQMSPLCDFWLASAIGRGQPIEVAVEVHKLQEWNLKDLHAQRCSLRVEDDIIYLDAEIAQAQAHLETLRTYRTSVF